MSYFEVKDHITIITGAAQGFGKEFAIRLLNCGARYIYFNMN